MRINNYTILSTMNKSVNVCFVANFYKTFLFHELAKKLQKSNIQVKWIVTKKEQHQFLCEHYGDKNVLYINRSFSTKSNKPINEYKLNELVYADRVLVHEMQLGIDYLTNIQQPIYDFLKNNDIQFVFGELTWSHEILIYRITKKQTELKCKYLECLLLRIPNNRLAFFNDDTQHLMLEFDEPIPENQIIKVEKPKYLMLNDNIVKRGNSIKGKLNRVKRFISGENIEENDPNVITDKKIRLRINSKEEYNKLTYKRIETLSFENVKDFNYVFVGFHKQPEASIDVNGRYYEDQAQNIINLWRMLPKDWKIVLKEHTNAIGDRSLTFYNRLLSFPGIVMVHENTDSKLLIANSRLVVTVTGTIGYEAALMKIPAITFAKVYFNKINYCRHIGLDELIQYNSLEDLVKELEVKEDNREEFTKYLYKNSFDGYISDYVTDPTVMEEENIQKLFTAYMAVISKYGR